MWMKAEGKSSWWGNPISFFMSFNIIKIRRNEQRTFILASFCSFAGLQLNIPQSFKSSSSTMSSLWWALSRSMRLADGCRLWHFMTVSCVEDVEIAVVVTAGFASVVETVVLCVCTGWYFAVVAVVLGRDSVSVSWGISALLSSWVSEYNPVISYCDSCRLNEMIMHEDEWKNDDKVKRKWEKWEIEFSSCDMIHAYRWPFRCPFWISEELGFISLSMLDGGCVVELIVLLKFCTLSDF